MAANLVILSSSPPRPALDTMSMSTSPGLPSPSVLVRQTRLTESPRSLLLPRNAVVGFKSSTVLLRDEAAQQHGRGQMAAKMKEREAANGVSIGREINEERRQAKKGRGKISTKKEAGLRKAEKQAMIKPMKVKKVVRAAAISKPDGKECAKGGKLTVHGHPTSPGGAINEATNDDGDLLSDGAMRRRVNWTPPKNTIPAVDLSVTPLTSPTGKEGELEESTVDGRPGKCFKDLMGNFGYGRRERPNPTTVPITLAVGSGARKRQRAELADPLAVVATTNGKESINKITPREIEITTKETESTELASLETEPGERVQRQQTLEGGTAKRKATTKRMLKDKVPKEKAPKRKATTKNMPREKASKEKAPRRKPKTITEQATRPYGVPSPSTPMFQYLAQQRTETHNDEGMEITAVKAIPPPKRSQKAQSVQINNGANKARPTPRRKKAIGLDLLSTLLSPRSAFRKMDEQVVLFGTSSQLAGEASSSLVLPLPMPSDEVIFPSESGGAIDSIGGVPRERIIPYSSTTGGLWSAASRDLDGSLMEVDVIDLATTPKVHNLPGKATKAKAIMPALPNQKPLLADTPLGNCTEGWAHVDDENASLMRPEHTSEPQPDSAYSSVSASVNETVWTNLTASEPSQPRLLQNKRLDPDVATNVSSMLRGQPAPVEVANVRPQKPAFAGYSTSQLSSELISYGFKPIKSRGQMIALLEKCWEGRNRAALKTPESRANIPASGRVENSRPVGRGVLAVEESLFSTKTKQSASVDLDANLLKQPEGSTKKTSSVSINPSEDHNRVSSKISECKLQGDLLTGMENVSSKGLGPGAIGVVSPKRPRGRPKKLGNSGSPPEEARGRGMEVSLVAKVAGQKVLSKRVGDQETDNLNADALSSAPCTPSIAADSSLNTSTAPTPTLSDEAKQQRRFDHITRAVASQASPGNALSMPSFHQKILMYDPIVLEDLAAWLNTKGLADIGVDTEVGAAEVRAWCELNSICCLWKGSQWGGARSRHG